MMYTNFQQNEQDVHDFYVWIYTRSCYFWQVVIAFEYISTMNELREMNKS